MQRWMRMALVLLLLACAACSPPVRSLHVISTDGTCRVEGASRLSAGEVTVTWEIRDPAPAVHGLWLLSLDEGRGTQDLSEALGAEFIAVFPPSWARVQGEFFPAAPGTRSEKTLVLDARPLYLVCMAGESPINTPQQPVKPYGILGPLRVVK